MTTITATGAMSPTRFPAVEDAARIAGRPASVVPRAPVPPSSLAVPAQRFEIEFARESLEQALKKTYVPAPVPSSMGRNLARFGTLALGLLSSVFLTSGGERNLAVLLGKLPDYVSEGDLQMASQAVAGAGMNAQKKPAGLDTSDKLGRFIVGAAALGRLQRDGKITQPVLAQALSRLQANVVAGRPASQGVFGATARSAPSASNATPKPGLPEIPKEFSYTDADLVKLLEKAGNRTLQQRVEDYRSRRTTPEQAREGLDDASKTRMNAWIDAIDRSRMTSGGATGGRSVTSGARSAAAKGDFPMARPVPAKNVVPPALDTSTWNLPMGERGDTFFGKQRVPAKYLPQPVPSQSPQATPPTGRGTPKSFGELEASLLGIPQEDTSVAFAGNNFGDPARTPNERFAVNLLEDQRNVASHFLKRTLADRPGQSPTSYLYGGHAAEGLFANITGKTYTEIATKVLLRVDELVKAGVLVKIGAGISNGVYLHKPTQQVIRVGHISSTELQATVGFSKIGNRRVGAKIDLGKSLYIPNELTSKNIPKMSTFETKTGGLAVLVMERVPGMRLDGNGYLLSSSAKTKVLSAAADALVTMHLNNRGHGDFGARSVNVTANGEVRAIDFELASPLKESWQVAFDLSGLTDILWELYPDTRYSGHKNVQSLVLNAYIGAIDRLAGPDRNAEVYKKHPELYEPHVARFNDKKEALKNNARTNFR